MARRWLLPLFACLGIFTFLGATLWVIDRSVVELGVGHTDLLIEFVVTNADSGEPLANARINVIPEEPPLEAPFDIRTDASGIGRRQQRCVFTDRVSTLRWTNAFYVRPPSWNIKVQADDYEMSELVYLPSYWGKAVQDGPGRSRLVVPIALRKIE